MTGLESFAILAKEYDPLIDSFHRNDKREGCPIVTVSKRKNGYWLGNAHIHASSSHSNILISSLKENPVCFIVWPENKKIIVNT